LVLESFSATGMEKEVEMVVVEEEEEEEGLLSMAVLMRFGSITM
jgi:hypothetical protein